ncbi:hypothetical protein ACWEHA_07695 [Amycolatopsis nivea]
MSESPAPAVGVLDRPTPMVLSVARRLREAFSRGEGFTAADAPRVIGLSSATDAQKAFVTFVGSEVTVSADSLAPPQLAWDVRWPDPVPAEADPEALNGFAGEVRTLLTAPEADWRSAAETFWERTKTLPGMPGGLSVYCFDEDASAEFGDVANEGYGLLGTAAALARVFGGRSLVMEELEGGELALNGPLSGFSALVGANLKVVCGEL